MGLVVEEESLVGANLLRNVRSRFLGCCWRFRLWGLGEGRGLGLAFRSSPVPGLRGEVFGLRLLALQSKFFLGPAV